MSKAICSIKFRGLACAREPKKNPTKMMGFFQPIWYQFQTLTVSSRNFQEPLKRNMFQSGEIFHLDSFNYGLYEHGIKQNLFSFCWGTIHQKNLQTPSCGFKSCSFYQFSKRNHHTTFVPSSALSVNFPHLFFRVLTNRSSLVRVTLSPTTKSTLGCWFVEGAGNR